MNLPDNPGNYFLYKKVMHDLDSWRGCSPLCKLSTFESHIRECEKIVSHIYKEFKTLPFEVRVGRFYQVVTRYYFQNKYCSIHIKQNIVTVFRGFNELNEMLCGKVDEALTVFRVINAVREVHGYD